MSSRHKRFLKSEKAKVKFKARKLPKGQNVTDTSFKTKQIVLSAQLRDSPSSEPQTKKKQNLKELLSCRNHYNPNMRQEAFKGLRELCVSHPEVLSTYLCKFIETGAAGCLDIECKVRSEALNLLHCVFSKVITVQLQPFMAILVSYLLAGMSHLKRDIQEDALRMLDIILAAAPQIVAQTASKLLPAFLEQISISKNTGNDKRVLCIDLHRNSTSTRWRIKVLGRLHAMLSAALSFTARPPNNASNALQTEWSCNEPCYAPAFMWKHEKPCHIDGLFTTGPGVFTQESLFQDDDEFQKYVTILMPLLFETWVEAGPSQRQQRETGTLIPTEAAELLECVMEIMQHLKHITEQKDQNRNNNQMTKWFKKHYAAHFDKHMMTLFPYYIPADNSAIKDGRRKGQAPFSETSAKSCQNQNLAICHMFCFFCEKPTKEKATIVLSYITKCLESSNCKSEQLLKVLHVFLNEKEIIWATTGINMQPMVDAVINRCLMHPVNVQLSPLFELLCDASVAGTSCKKQGTNRDARFSKFIQDLPKLLLLDCISSKALETMIRLASVQCTCLFIGMIPMLQKILENIHHLRAEGIDQQAVKFKVLAVLYHASVWRQDVLHSVARYLSHSEHNKDLETNFRQLLIFRRDCEPASVVSKKINTMSWFIPPRETDLKLAAT